MSVAAVVTIAALKEECGVAQQFASAAGILLDWSKMEDGLIVGAVFSNAENDQFYAEFHFADYPMFPPTVEFTSEDGAQRAQTRLYPNGFHNLPCVCARYNRKAYRDVGGPHADWRLVDWRLATPSGGPIDSFAMMLSDLEAKIRNSCGRLG